ncbi:MAG: hypothetical protein AABX32_05115 [Nanoarchaeota archaeon]
MKKIYFVLFILTIFLTACTPETKVYKVNYKLNYPEGAFKVNVGNSTAFTNGNDILEVYIKKNPEFFCYSVNNQSLCSLELEIKISDKAANSFKSAVENFQEIMQKSGKNKTILPQRISYYLNNQKLEQEDVIKTNEKIELNNQFLIPILGKGNTQDESKKNAVDSENAVVKVLIDKK